MSKTRARIIKAAQQDDLDVWSLPNVQSDATEEQVSHTNAFGKKANWQYEPPEEDIVEPEPLTAEEIESIRQAAHEEGFNQGKEEGFTKGYEEGKAQGLTEGTTQGLEEGKEKGLAQGKDEIDSLSERWQNLIEQLDKPLANVEKNIEDQLLNLVVQLTEAVVLQEAKTNPDILIAAIATGIKALPSNEANTQIHLHPDDIKHVEQQFGEQHIRESGWRLLPSPQLTPGSCQIENSTSNIDLQMKSRLKQVLESFLQDALHQ
ncbi:flagellar assembly protein FliH [Candidatus Colwellia aromaticivorans]|uniref:flagellar assembly protein FliH n=1 Tax=Candidatus Colwellia aromaticivorans TaxID=2267621 RepID=UPI000DF47D00|nr:flagellar assembly protein FliH [Candidatus Colwellia aromaticivorans]